LGNLKYGVEHKCAYIFKVDDEYCMDVDAVPKLLAEHETNFARDELYIGYYKFLGTEYSIMSGPRGDHAPYMSGWIYGVSYILASYIVNQDWTHSVLHHSYGTSSEDANMGMWVDYASKTHNISVRYVTAPSIYYTIPMGQVCNESLPGAGT